MKKKIKLGIIGSGIAANKLHLPALKKLAEEFEIVAVCSRTEEKAKALSEKIGNIPYYTDYKKLLKNKEIEAVDIALPIDLNYKVTKAALKAGKHVIVEKPIAANLKDADKMLLLQKKYDMVMMVAENYRYKNLFKKTKEILESGRLGKPYAAQWNLFQQMTTANEYGATRWRQKNIYPGGFITDGGVHHVAALRTLFGEASSVYSFADCINPAIGNMDTLNSIITFKSGIKVNYNVLFSAVSSYENRILIFCSNGTIEIRENTLQVKNADSSVDVEDFGTETGFTDEFRNFYLAITSDAKIISSFDEAYKDFNLVMKLIRSSEKNKVITLK
jgi:predicted dehydrogenase